MAGKIVFDSVEISSLLSFGDDEPTTVDLWPLNVLVGTNGSGKSNFLEALRVMCSLPNNFDTLFRTGGGIEAWLWKGSSEKETTSVFRRKGIEISVLLAPFMEEDTLEEGEGYVRHSVSIIDAQNRPFIRKERVSVVDVIYPYQDDEGEDSDSVEQSNELVYEEREDLYVNDFGRANILTHVAHRTPQEELIEYEHTIVTLKSESFDITKPVLSQRNDPDLYPELHELVKLYAKVGFFTESQFGRSTAARSPQDAALDSAFLFPDASNLALVLNDLQNKPQVFRSIIENLKRFYPRVENIITRVQGGTVQIFFQEEGLTQTVPATRLSDGTLRYLCLLVLLCHPTPPPVMCIEEPELGMHPDVLPVIAELLIEASQRSQLIVTTHSDLLVSAIGEKHPEAIVVCERTAKGTTMNRLNPESLTEWLKDYSLGEVWLRGGIGGVRS